MIMVRCGNEQYNGETELQIFLIFLNVFKNYMLHSLPEILKRVYIRQNPNAAELAFK